MATKENLPWDLVEEILSRVPPSSLVRFKTVCKRWNTLFNDKTFINNHKKTFHFILTTRSKIYSVSVNPKVEVHELTLDFPGLESQLPNEDLIECNGFLLCSMGNRAVAWNPCLRQTRYINPEYHQPHLKFLGIGYDNDNDSRVEEIVYKTLLIYKKDVDSLNMWKIHDFASDAWIDEELELPCGDIFTFHCTRGVSLNGTLYFVAYYDEKSTTHHPMLFILVSFDFSRKEFKVVCDLPCGKNHHRRDALALRVFREDRLSLLKQCHVTKKIKIWVTKNKIDKNVKWTSFMDVSVPNLPGLVKPSYFLDDKRLVICSCDKTGRAWIYVMGENKLISKIKLDSVVDPWPLHCTYFPSLVLVPEVKEKTQNYKFYIYYFFLPFHFFFLLLVLWFLFTCSR